MIKKLYESFEKRIKETTNEKVNLTLESLAELNEEEHDEQVIKDTLYIGPRKYSIEVYPDVENGYIAHWEDDSDNGFGYNNKGWVNLSKNSQMLAFKEKGYADIEDYISVISVYDRPLRPEVKHEIIKKVLTIRGEGQPEDIEENLTEDSDFKEREYNKAFRYTDINEAPWFKEVIEKAVKPSERSGNRIYVYFGSEKDAIEAINKLEKRNIGHIHDPLENTYDNTFRVDILYNFSAGRPSKERKFQDSILESLDENVKEEVEVELEDILERNPNEHGFNVDTEEIKEYVKGKLKEKGYQVEVSQNGNQLHIEYFNNELTESKQSDEVVKSAKHVIDKLENIGKASLEVEDIGALKKLNKDIDKLLKYSKKDHLKEAIQDKNVSKELKFTQRDLKAMRAYIETYYEDLGLTEEEFDSMSKEDLNKFAVNTWEKDLIDDYNDLINRGYTSRYAKNEVMSEFYAYLDDNGYISIY